MSLYEPLFRALEEGAGRFVVVGGVAVVLHGYVRLTADLDLVVDLEVGAVTRTLSTLSALGLAPRAPVEALAFADPAQRQRWIAEKGMEVFSLVDPRNPLLSVDLFAAYPVEFERLWADAVVVPVGDVAVRIASIAHLIEMKGRAGRARDLDDIAHLELIAERRTRND